MWLNCASILIAVAALGACWLCWQLLRQNGRILLRLEALEKWVDRREDSEVESARNRPVPQPDGRTGESKLAPPASPEAQHAGSSGNGREHRFGSRSLERSKINRTGLKPGTLAPGFCLPRLDGRGDLALGELRGSRVLLVFSDPHCGPCDLLAPRLEKFHREHAELDLILISRGDPQENRMKARRHGLTFPIVLQQHWEISGLYEMFATPIAYLVDESGFTAAEVAVGAEAILKLAENLARRGTGSPA